VLSIVHPRTNVVEGNIKLSTIPMSLVIFELSFVERIR